MVLDWGLLAREWSGGLALDEFLAVAFCGEPGSGFTHRDDVNSAHQSRKRIAQRRDVRPGIQEPLSLGTENGKDDFGVARVSRLLDVAPLPAYPSLR
jgi:hypothetical protein